MAGTKWTGDGPRTLDDKDGGAADIRERVRILMEQPAETSEVPSAAPGPQEVPSVPRSRLVLHPELSFLFPARRPGLWRRFWLWALLGWRWEEL